jgi:hypothetical protein
LVIDISTNPFFGYGNLLVRTNANSFFCLILQGRLNTRAHLKKKNMQLTDYTCVLCICNVEEDLIHLLFQCPFSLACWDTLHLIVPNTSDTVNITESFRAQLQLPFFMEIIITMCWSIWTMRNDVIFSSIPHSVQRCKVVFRKEFALVILRARSKYHPTIDLWLEAFV